MFFFFHSNVCGLVNFSGLCTYSLSQLSSCISQWIQWINFTRCSGHVDSSEWGEIKNIFSNNKYTSISANAQSSQMCSRIAKREKIIFSHFKLLLWIVLISIFMATRNLNIIHSHVFHWKALGWKQPYFWWLVILTQKVWLFPFWY